MKLAHKQVITITMTVTRDEYGCKDYNVHRRLLEMEGFVEVGRNQDGDEFNLLFEKDLSHALEILTTTRPEQQAAAGVGMTRTNKLYYILTNDDNGPTVAHYADRGAALNRWLEEVRPYIDDYCDEELEYIKELIGEDRLDEAYEKLYDLYSEEYDREAFDGDKIEFGEIEFYPPSIH